MTSMPLTAWGSRAAGTRRAHSVADADGGGLHVQRVLLGLEQERVHAAVDQAARLDRVRLAHLVEGDVARDRDRARPRTHGTDDESCAGDLAGEAGRGPRELGGPLGEAVLAEYVRRSAERVGRYNVGAGLQIRSVNRPNDVGSGQGQVLVAALVRRAPEVGGREPRLLNHGAHGAVEDEDALPERVAKGRHRGIVTHMTIPTLALDGVRVIDCSRVLAGPFCGMLLADLGADVIKVEDTGPGDESRTWPPHKGGESAAYLVINRNKRDITLDLKSPEGAEALLNHHAEGYLLTGAVPKALGSSHPSLSPYRNFRCRDGQWVFIAGANDRFWQRLVPALGLAWMATDPRFASNIERVKHRKELEAELDPAIAQHDREPLLKILEAARVPATPVNTVDQVMQDPQTAARQIFERVVHPQLGDIPVLGTPLKFSRMRPGVRTPAPRQGH